MQVFIMDFIYKIETAYIKIYKLLNIVVSDKLANNKLDKSSRKKKGY